MNRLSRACSGRIRLSTTWRSNPSIPSDRPSRTSAIPPVTRCLSTVYRPSRAPIFVAIDRILRKHQRVNHGTRPRCTCTGGQPRMELFGTWQLESIIAVGGLGEIWYARRAAGAAGAVAVKRLHTHLLRNEAVRAQFAIEQKLATELPPHPSVVHGIEAGAVGDRPYIALALAPGEDLRRMLVGDVREPAAAPRVVLPRARVLAIAIAACDAAAHLHGCGFVHGDINPGNLVVATDDRVTLIDLGIAREIGTGGAVRGTHAY